MEVAENNVAPPETTPSPTTAPSISLGRAVAWYGLLQRLGWPEMLNALNAPAPPPEPHGEPETLAAVFKQSFGPPQPGVARMTFDFSHIFAQIVQEGLMVEFAALVLDVPEDEAERADVTALTEAIGPFVKACFALLREVIMPATRLN